MSEFGWLLDLLVMEPATPAPNGVAPGVAERANVRGRTATTADEMPHLPHQPHPESSDGRTHAAATEGEQYARARENDLVERLTERSATLEYDMGRTVADPAAVRIVQCSTCVHWAAHPQGGGGIGTCATRADAESSSAHDRRPVSPWPDAPRHCAGWEGASHG
jgi:hypothetical protein